jgi:hypothetical protein
MSGNNKWNVGDKVKCIESLDGFFSIGEIYHVKECDLLRADKDEQWFSFEEIPNWKWSCKHRFLKQ